MLNWFKNRKIGTRILIGYFIVIVVTAAVGVFSVTSLRRVDNDYALSYADSADALALTEDLSSSFQRLRMNTYGVVLADSKEDKDYYNGRIDNFVQEFRASHGEFVQILEAYDDDLEEKVILQRMEKQYEDYLVVLEDFIKTYAMDTYFRDRAYHELKNGDLRELALELDATIGQLIEEEKQFVNGEIARNRAAANNATIVTIIGIAIGVIVAIVLGMLIARNISSNIKLVVEASNLLAEGDVNVSVEIDTDDELGELAEAFGRMVVNTQEQARIAERIADGDMTVEVNVRSERDLLASKLREIVEKNNEVLGNVVSASEQVAAGAEQVSDSSMSLSQGAAEQASSIEELTASIEQISTQTQENAENANKANQLADGAKVHATQGNDQMKDMLGAMEEINEASANISNIIKVIDDIAFQTNILALNAAVEAARAGQHGKGFAVVAEEVRTLAARSADAANETTELIEGSIRKTEAGTKIAEETAEALYEVIKEIEIVAELVEGIANASNEQAAGIAQINQGVMQVSAVVQANSATSEESAAASEELSSQAALLEELVRQFRLKQVTRRASGPTDLSPEVLQMLENLGQQERRKEKAPRMKEGKPQIALSDQEFGKY